MSRLYFTILCCLLLPWCPMKPSSEQEPATGRFVKVYADNLGAALQQGGPLGLYLVLLKFADHDGVCFPGEAVLAKALGQSTSNIRRHAAKLEAIGLIERPRQGVKVGPENPYRVALTGLTSRKCERGLRADVSEAEEELRADLHATSRKCERGLRADVSEAPHEREPSTKSHELEALPSSTDIDPLVGDVSLYPDLPAVPGLLRQAGVTEIGVHKLTHHPGGQGCYWGARWLVWVTVVKITSEGGPGGFIYSRAFKACEGDRECQQPPLAWIAQQEQKQREQKRRQRAASVAASRPDPFAAQKAAAKPASGTAVLPDLAAVWEHIRQGVAPTIRAYLAAATAVDLQGDALVIEMPATNAGLLKRHCETLLQLAQSVRPEIAGLHFETNGGRNA